MEEITKCDNCGNKLNFEFNVTDDCNLNCVYCSEAVCKREHRYISKSVADECIKYLENKSKIYDSIYINFFGGEPLLGIDSIKYITNSLNKYKNITYGIITNGILLENNINFFKQYKDKFSIQISYDGNPNHDANRNNSSKQVKKAIDLVAKNKLHYYIHSVIRPKDFCHLYEAYMDLNSFETNDYITFVVEYGNDLSKYSEEEKNSWLKDLDINLKLIMKQELSSKKYKLSWLNMYSPTYNNLRAYCYAGNNNFSVNYDGNIYICHGTIYSDNSKEHLIGSIFDIDIDAKLKETSLEFNEHRKNQYMSKECLNCDSLICYNCHACNFDNNYEHVDNNDYFAKWNSRNSSYICNIYKLISRYIRAYDVLKSEVI